MKLEYVICLCVFGLVMLARPDPPDSRTIRSCGSNNSSYSDSCYSRGGFGGRQEVCTCMTDKCNHASQVSMESILILAPIALIFTCLFQSSHKF